MKFDWTNARPQLVAIAILVILALAGSAATAEAAGKSKKSISTIAGWTAAAGKPVSITAL